MIVQKLHLNNFKNHKEKSFDFSSQINCFVGDNGIGKTNILDALHYVSVGKSFLGTSDFQNIRQDDSENDAEFFSIDSQIFDGEKENSIKILLPKEGKKIIKKNDKTYDRISDHIGFLPSVMISPYDSNLISDGGESRRKFLDAMISQTDSEYLYGLIQYQKTLKQRNALLKYFAKNRTFDVSSLEIYNQPLQNFGTLIFEKRKEFITKLNPVIQYFYKVISDGRETISVIYQSDLDEDNFVILNEEQRNEESHSDKKMPQQIQHDRMLQLLQENLQKDRVLTYTSKGVHKDDLAFEMNGNLLKKFGSQGQQKSFLIALKLAQMNLIKELTEKTPILLLDDIFDKLDDHRVSQLIELVNQENFGQIFITDTHRERTESVVKRINEEAKIFQL